MIDGGVERAQLIRRVSARVQAFPNVRATCLVLLVAVARHLSNKSFFASVNEPARKR